MDDLAQAIEKYLFDRYNNAHIVTGYAIAVTSEQVKVDDPTFHVLTGNDGDQPIVTTIGLLEAASVVVRNDFGTMRVDLD